MYRNLRIEYAYQNDKYCRHNKNVDILLITFVVFFFFRHFFFSIFTNSTKFPLQKSSKNQRPNSVVDWSVTLANSWILSSNRRILANSHSELFSLFNIKMFRFAHRRIFVMSSVTLFWRWNSSGWIFVHWMPKVILSKGITPIDAILKLFFDDFWTKQNVHFH